MVFDEAQMLPSTTAHGLAVGFSTYFGPTELGRIETEIEPLKYGNNSYLRLELETLVNLADVTVFFLDPRQSTSGKDQNLLTEEALRGAEQAGTFEDRSLVTSLKMTETKRGSPRFNAFEAHPLPRKETISIRDNKPRIVRLLL